MSGNSFTVSGVNPSSASSRLSSGPPAAVAIGSGADAAYNRGQAPIKAVPA